MKRTNPFSWQEILRRVAPPAPVITFDDNAACGDDCGCELIEQDYSQSLTLDVGGKRVQVTMLVSVD